MAEERVQFCMECREETSYRMRKVPHIRYIREKKYVFDITEAVCEKCGQPVNIPGLMDQNAREIDRQYRLKENIATAEHILKLMAVYRLGKAPLSLALGFGEITITRYLAGQVPSKEYSDIIINALESPQFMKDKLHENAEKIGEAAYRKALNAAKELEPLFALSDKMLLTISYIFKKAGEVTPLALQKMLYFIQGLHMVLRGEALFCEDCEAWAHGPVYREVYEVFKSFKYNPIDDNRFSMFENRCRELSDNEREVIDLVMNSFGMYSGKALERITHEEAPWKEARNGYLPGEPSGAVITKEVIQQYFAEVEGRYDLKTVEGINHYIADKLR